MWERIRKACRRLADGWKHDGGRTKRRVMVMAVVAVAVAAFAVFAFMPHGGAHAASVPTNVGLSVIRDGKNNHIDTVVVEDARQHVTVNFIPGHDYRYKGKDYSQIEFISSVGQTEELGRILEHGHYRNGYVIQRPKGGPSMLDVITNIAFFALLFFVVASMLPAMKGFGKTRAEDVGDVTFDSVKGEETAVAEMSEVKDMLIRPEKYMEAGAQMPKGILLYGEPGTGKTLLARALAGETNSSFYAANGAQFVEMFVGLGARRIRKLFKAARDNTPAIVFIDEIDAIGGTRGRDSNSEREQTLNQLLVELDGFKQNGQVLVVAATNRIDFLDKALLRPGRFDRQIEVDMPDAEGREAILEVHAEGKKLGDDVDFAAIAHQTIGMSGAQLANVVNEAALMAVRNGDGVIRQSDLSEGIDRVLFGPKKDSRTDYRKDMRHTAYHEGGHAITAMALKDSDPVTKITILPRGRALGYTIIGSDDDATNYTRNQILARLAQMMGGRAAEELKYGDPSTGAADDIRKAAQVARDYVSKYGFGGRLGYWDEDHEHVSDATASRIDSEVENLLKEALDTARAAVEANSGQLDRLADLLVEKETVGSDDIAGISKDIAPVEWKAENHD